MLVAELEAVAVPAPVRTTSPPPGSAMEPGAGDRAGAGGEDELLAPPKMYRVRVPAAVFLEQQVAVGVVDVADVVPALVVSVASLPS